MVSALWRSIAHTFIWSLCDRSGGAAPGIPPFRFHIFSAHTELPPRAARPGGGGSFRDPSCVTPFLHGFSSMEKHCSYIHSVPAALRPSRRPLPPGPLPFSHSWCSLSYRIAASGGTSRRPVTPPGHLLVPILFFMASALWRSIAHTFIQFRPLCGRPRGSGIPLGPSFFRIHGVPFHTESPPRAARPGGR